MPSVSIASLIVIGSPCSGRQRSPRARRASAASAAATRPFDVERDDRVDRPVEPLDAIEVELEQLSAGDLPGAQRGGELGGGSGGPGVVQHAAIVRRPRREAPAMYSGVG